jgi:2-enoate reductase
LFFNYEMMICVLCGLKKSLNLGERPNLYLIGDAREPRNIMGAIWDAFEVARAI